ncbi:hypothetical protein GCM10009609_20830 [Pseudonocardia aurantiaca]|uniref:DinB family protein n=1 Tax=Pseudonocardia aurantiaca TaxID=75290 RepID=A0ABW4FFY3_9PSEU
MSRQSGSGWILGLPGSARVRPAPRPPALAVRPDLVAPRTPPRAADLVGWWWSVTLDHLQGRTPRERTEIGWPGTAEAAVGWLRDLRAEWVAVLDRLTGPDLDAPAPFPWPADSGLTVAHTVAWVNAELMKNATEIGQLRLLRAASEG